MRGALDGRRVIFAVRTRLSRHRLIFVVIDP